MDVEDIIDYIKSLKKGFDKDLFKRKIEELSYAADNFGLSNNDIHTLFKVWLNLTIPLTNWKNIGMCLIPQNRVEEHTVDYAFRWILYNMGNEKNYSRLAFLLDWLTAAMDHECVDITALDMGYEIFYTLLRYEELTINTTKLVYTLTKPEDITRSKVLDLLKFVKNTQNKRNLTSQLLVILALFKSYRPVYVPENIPTIAVHTVFKKIDPVLLGRFKKIQAKRNINSCSEFSSLMCHPIKTLTADGKKATQPLIQSITFDINGSKTSCLLYSDALTVLRDGSVPRLGAALSHDVGLTLAALELRANNFAFAHDLHHLMELCVLGRSPYSETSRRMALARVGELQRTAQRGHPAVTRALAQYLSFWNERDHFKEILALAEWVDADSGEYVLQVARALSRAASRTRPLRRCAFMHTLSNMYCNLIYTIKRDNGECLNAETESAYTKLLSRLASDMGDTCNSMLQVDPEDLRALECALNGAVRSRRAEIRASVLGASETPHPLMLAVSFSGPSPAYLDKLAELLLLYKQLMSMNVAANRSFNQNTLTTLHRFCSDLIASFFHEEALNGREYGLLFAGLHPHLIEKLQELVPDANATYSLKRHLAFGSYTYNKPDVYDHSVLFNMVIRTDFTNLAELLYKIVPELSQM